MQKIINFSLGLPVFLCQIVLEMRIFLALSLLAFVTSCGNHKSDSNNQGQAVTKPVANPTSNLSESGNKVLMATIFSYYNLKDALVATDATKTAEAANQLGKIADSLRSTVFSASDSTHANATLRPYMDTVVTQSQAIAAAKDATCEQQRLAFGVLSGSMYALLKKAEMKNAGIYHAYCPMAFNDKGAYWLSAVSEIKNPYFGKKMLECGEVTDSL
jgi:hypothetical protein